MEGQVYILFLFCFLFCLCILYVHQPAIMLLIFFPWDRDNGIETIIMAILCNFSTPYGLKYSDTHYLPFIYLDLFNQLYEVGSHYFHIFIKETEMLLPAQFICLECRILYKWLCYLLFIYNIFW